MSTAADTTFSRVALLTGESGLQSLQQARVLLLGLGGVGSWTAEALVRTGIRDITLVDADRVAPSNINRQMPALADTVGQLKTAVVAERLRAINPAADVREMPMLYSADTAPIVHLEQYDYVVDAIDSLADKALLILNATAARRPVLFSSMGAALRFDPTRVATAEFWRVQGDGLAAALRHRFRHNATFPASRFTCVYSTEPPARNHIASRPLADGSLTYGKRTTNGALCPVTATFGMTLASLVVRHCLAMKY